MPKSKNDISTVKITISTTNSVQNLLTELVDTGMFGKNTAEAAEQLVRRSLENLLNDNTIIKWKDSTK